MKKLFALLLLCTALPCFGQDPIITRSEVPKTAIARTPFKIRTSATMRNEPVRSRMGAYIYRDGKPWAFIRFQTELDGFGEITVELPVKGPQEVWSIRVGLSYEDSEKFQITVYQRGALRGEAIKDRE